MATKGKRGREEAPAFATASGKRPRRYGADVSSWSGLPDDLVRDVLGRLPSFADRAGIRAVCRQWRVACRRHPMVPNPPVPWLAMPGHYVSLPDAAVHRVALPEDARAASCRGSFQNWLALVPPQAPAPGSPSQPFLLEAFSMERILLPPWTEEQGKITKIVLSSAPNLGSFVAAAVVAGCDGGSNGQKKIAVCRPGDSSWGAITAAFDLRDIIFYEGNLHALTSSEKLIVFDVQELGLLRREPWQHDEENMEAAKKAAAGGDEDLVLRYLVECHGLLLMVNRYHATGKCGNYHTNAFTVFALDMAGPSEECWLPVKALDGRALFVGATCCGSFPASEAQGLVGESKICYVDFDDLYAGKMRCPPFRAVETFCMGSYFYKNIAQYRPDSSSATTGRWVHYMDRSSPADDSIVRSRRNPNTLTQGSNDDQSWYAASRLPFHRGVAHLDPFNDTRPDASSSDDVTDDEPDDFVE